MSPAARLREFRAEKKLSQRDMAADLGFSAGLLGSLETGAREFSDRVINRLRDIYGLNPDWLLTGVGERFTAGIAGFSSRLGPVRPPGTHPMAGDVEVGGVEFAFVRRFEVTASAGPGRVIQTEDAVSQMGFSRDWLLAHRVAADLCGLVEAHGDSMEPTIPDGALMLVNFGIDFNVPPGVYLARRGDELVVKRLAVTDRDAVGRPLAIDLISDNREYAAWTVKGDDLRDFQPIARVITVIRDV